MKKMRLAFFLLCTSAISLGAQERWTGGISYVYQYAPQWDSIIRAFNYARPYKKEALGLFISGAEISCDRTIRFGEKPFGIQPGLSYALFSSRADMSDASFVRASVHSLHLHSGLFIGPREDWRFFLDPSFSVFCPTVRSGPSPTGKKSALIMLTEDKKYRPLSVAFRLGVGFAWPFTLSAGKIYLAPFVRADWYPSWVELNDYSSALNGSYAPSLNDESLVWQFSAGIKYAWGKMKS